MRRLLFILFLFATAGVFAAETKYDWHRTDMHCVVCGKGPLTEHIWMTTRGPLCDDCEKLKDHCSICGLPVRDGDGHIKTEDGRFICRYDKDNVLLTLDAAQELFDKTRDEVVDLYGPQFALKYTDVTIKLFDVDYWSENGGRNGLHAFGFASTRKNADGRCTHEVIMLSGRTREEMIGVAAHEYTHLWINENRPEDHNIDADTVEAICELTAYKLMQKKNLPEMQKRILANPYTGGKINTLVAVEHDGGTDYVLNWVKASKASTFDDSGNAVPLPAHAAPAPIYYQPRALPAGLKFTGVMEIGRLQAVVNGSAFSVGDQKTLKLRDTSVAVRCDAINPDEIKVTVNGAPMTLKKGEEKIVR